MDLHALRLQICDVCHKMWQQSWVAANDGNISVKLDDGTFLCTPTGVSKSFITEDMILRVDQELNVLEGSMKPSSEMKMHLRCYKEREDVRAVVHAHPPTATGYAVAGKSLDEYSMIETVIAIGSIPLTPYGTPSTYEVPDAIAPYLAKHDVLLLQNHGALTVGCDLITAYYRMETLCQDQPDGAPAGRGEGDSAAADRQAAGPAGELLSCNRAASRLSEISERGRTKGGVTSCCIPRLAFVRSLTAAGAASARALKSRPRVWPRRLRP